MHNSFNMNDIICVNSINIYHNPTTNIPTTNTPTTNTSTTGTPTSNPIPNFVLDKYI